MKKNVYNLWLFAALLCGLSLGVTSCKDDDNNEVSAEEQAEQAKEQADVFWGVVDELAGADAITDDYQNKTFEPIIGTPSDENPQHRIVATNDMYTAAMRFNQLIGEDKVDENTTEYVYQNDAVGTLTYRKSTDGKSWATVDVSIKQMPHLQKIIYRSPEQADSNGPFEGTAYYRFGDIVTRTVTAKDGTTHYEDWICVRPCFGPEGKEKSHWVSISPLSSDNVWPYTGSNGIEYAMPTGLGENVEHAQNFAEMLYAICFPKKWHQNVFNQQDNKDMRMFHDFNKVQLKYHSHYFWQRVNYGWVKENKIFEDLFGSSVAKFQTMLESKDGLNLLTKGYNWITRGIFATNSPKLHRERFTTGQGIESNMHQGGKITAVTKEVIKNKIQLNVNEQYTLEHPYWVNAAFFGTDAPHYIIRHATGAELSSNGKEDPKQPLAGVTHKWVYNVHYGITDLTVPPETFDEQGNPTNESGYKNRAYYSQGDIVKDANGNRWMCVQPSGYGDADRFKKEPYSYFISFEKKPIEGSLLVTNVPATKNLAAQVLFSLSLLYQNYVPKMNDKSAVSYQIVQNMRDNLGVELSELIVKRDTLHTFKGKTVGESVPCSFVSALYRDADNNLLVLRLVGDYTKEQASGGRDMSWYFYTNYTNTTTPMLLNHLGDSAYVNNKYNEDKWVYQPWFDIATSKIVTYTTKNGKVEYYNAGPRTYVMGAYNLEINQLIYKRGESVLTSLVQPANMYREPLILFAVKRVRDNGVKATSFDDGIEFSEYKMMKEIDDDFADDDPRVTNRISDTYQQYSPDRIFLEEKNWQFGMANSTKSY
ncbi:MAG: hypothetical protein IKZ48_04470 [Prevotella sp.]|nr:hypothetical protein [Prevotella sp.]